PFGRCLRAHGSLPTAGPRSDRDLATSNERKRGVDAPLSEPKVAKMDSESFDRMTIALMSASPTDETQMALLDRQPVIQILPDANVIKIGGQSFIDRGRAAVFPLIEEVVENLPRHKMIIGTGAGT